MQLHSQNNRILRLEYLRGFAAFYVLLSHFFGYTKWTVFRFGQEAVMLFFVLSGFVIYRSTFSVGQKQPFKIYFLHRFRRIYPLYLIALVLSVASALICDSINISKLIYDLSGHFVFLQDNRSLKSGVWFNTFGGNSALWSLTYEWWFYMFFYLTISLFNDIRLQQAFALFLSIGGCIAYSIEPNQISLICGYYYLWWSGVELAREYGEKNRITWKKQFANIFCLLLMTAIWFLPLFVQNKENLRFGVEPVLQFRHQLSTLLIVILSIAWYKFHWFGFDTFFCLFRYIAPISYAIYIFHMPVHNFLEYYGEFLPKYSQFLIGISVIIPLSYFTELVLQKKVNHWFSTREKV